MGSAIGLRQRYAMPGTAIPYAASTPPLYAVSFTTSVWRTTRPAVSTRASPVQASVPGSTNGCWYLVLGKVEALILVDIIVHNKHVQVIVREDRLVHAVAAVHPVEEEGELWGERKQAPGQRNAVRKEVRRGKKCGEERRGEKGTEEGRGEERREKGEREELTSSRWRCTPGCTRHRRRGRSCSLEASKPALAPGIA
eukprot:1607532-Rhodomonas_salina.4